MSFIHSSIAAPDIGGAIKFWFAHLDQGATKAAAGPRVIEGVEGAVEFPPNYYNALSFVVFDAGSPWYQRADAPTEVTDKVMFALAKLHDDMLVKVKHFAEMIEQRMPAP